MKNWSADDWLRIIFGCTICACLLIYFTGMFILKQATNDQNRELRIALVGLLTFIAGQITATFNNKNKLK